MIIFLTGVLLGLTYGCLNVIWDGDSNEADNQNEFMFIMCRNPF